MTQPADDIGDASAERPDTRRTVWLVAIAIVIAVIIFGVVFPRLVDWGLVFDILGGVDGWQIALLVALGVVRYLPAGWLYQLVLPGLTLRQGIASWTATTALASSTPGLDIPLRFAMNASWGHPAERTTSAMFLSGIVEMSTKYALAVVGVGVWALFEADVTVALIALIGALMLVAVGGVVAAALRSERRTRQFAVAVDRAARTVLGWASRSAPDDLVDRIVDVRVEARSVLGRRWKAAFIAASIAQVLGFLILLLSMRAVGIDADTLTWFDILLAEGVVIILTTIPITPGNIGIAEGAYLLVLVPIAGREAADVIAAGVLLTRMIVWLLPILIGWLITLRWQAATGSSLLGRTDRQGAG